MYVWLPTVVPYRHSPTCIMAHAHQSVTSTSTKSVTSEKDEQNKKLEEYGRKRLAESPFQLYLERENQKDNKKESSGNSR